MKATVLHRLPASPKKVIALVRSVITAMTGNPSFPSPTPPLATIRADVDALELAEAAVLVRTRGNKEMRDAKLTVVREDYAQLATYVQTIANANPAQAAAIIESAGMSLKKPSLRNTPAFAVRDGLTSGSVTLISKKAGDRASYRRQYSLDGKTWVDVGVTLKTRATISGLTPGLLYLFQCRVTTKSGPGDWSEVVTHLVR
jgi:hypothetical protein